MISYTSQIKLLITKSNGAQFTLFGKSLSQRV